MTDIELVVAAIRTLDSISPSADPAWSQPAALKVIDCVLSLGRHYDHFVVPRLKSFERSHPDVKGVPALHALMNSFPSPDRFMEQALNYRHPVRAQTLSGVVSYLVDLLNNRDSTRSENDCLNRWANEARPSDYKTVGVRGFGLAGYQYLRMLFGADTTKPDVHIRRFVRDALKHPVSDMRALEILERAASLTGVKPRDLDTTIWENSARRRKWKGEKPCQVHSEK